jgi:hypothetical protein
MWSAWRVHNVECVGCVGIVLGVVGEFVVNSALQVLSWIMFILVWR